MTLFLLMFKPCLCHFVCVWIRLLCFQPLHKWNSKNYLHLIYKHGGKRFLGNTDIRARSFIFPKEVFPWHTQDIKRLLTSHYCGWFGTDIEYTIYDEKTIQRTLTKYESGALVTEWNVTTWYIFSICPGQLNNTDIDCPLVPGSEPIKMIAYWTPQSDPRH